MVAFLADDYVVPGRRPPILSSAPVWSPIPYPKEIEGARWRAMWRYRQRLIALLQSWSWRYSNTIPTNTRMKMLHLSTWYSGLLRSFSALAFRRPA